MQRLNYYWRVLATGWCFLSFSLGGLLLTVTAFPFIRIFERDPIKRRDKIQLVIHNAFRFFIGQMKFLGVMSVELHGAEKLRQAGGVLVLANHPTLIDVVLMISLMPRADCIVKESLWQHKGFGGVIRAAGYIPNRNAEQLVRDCDAVLATQRPLIIFPEGTRTTPGQPMSFQRGASHIALHSKAPILPVVLTCNPPSLTKDKRWYQIPERRFHVRLEVKPSCSAADFLPEVLEKPLAARQLTRSLQQYFAKEVMAP